jgi:asparagine synthase (glutamine-hydrolysing)
MLGAMRPFGPGPIQGRELAGAAFGRTFQPILPEDDFDLQPLICPRGRYLFVADGRIDNRSELTAELGISSEGGANLCDAELLLRAWIRRQLNLFDRVLGDFALAVWDREARLLTLARSALATRTLFYARRHPSWIAFSSMPHGLFALEDVRKTLSLPQVATFAAGLPVSGAETFFEDIFTVRHGEAIELSADGQLQKRLWDPREIAPVPRDRFDYGEALRHELDRAVIAQSRRRAGHIGTHLSAGRDSSAVTATAALTVSHSDEPIFAFTGAPNEGYCGPSIGNRIADESELAAMTAAHAQVEHVICRSRKRSLAHELRIRSAAHHYPIANPSAIHWEAEIFDQAGKRGVTVLLAGFTGNYTISSNGPRHLRDLWLDQGAVPWWKQAWRIGRTSWGQWRTICNLTFGPDLPGPAHSVLLRLGGRSPRVSPDASLWNDPLRSLAEQVQARQRPYEGMKEGYRELRKSHILNGDEAQRMSLAVAGIDQRDPTSDRRLVELCLAIPPDLLASRPVEPSPVYVNAFGDRIPEAVLHNRRRGYQGADWYEMFEPAEVGALFEQLAGNPAVEALLDMEAIRTRIASWPRSGDPNWVRLAPYRNSLLRALALADFVDFHFPR